MFRFALSIMRLQDGHQPIHFVIEVVRPVRNSCSRISISGPLSPVSVHGALPARLPPLEVLYRRVAFRLAETQQFDPWAWLNP